MKDLRKIRNLCVYCEDYGCCLMRQAIQDFDIKGKLYKKLDLGVMECRDFAPDNDVDKSDDMYKMRLALRRKDYDNI